MSVRMQFRTVGRACQAALACLRKESPPSMVTLWLGQLSLQHGLQMGMSQAFFAVSPVLPAAQARADNLLGLHASDSLFSPADILHT